MSVPERVRSTRLLFRDMDVDLDGAPMVGPFNWTLGVRTGAKPYDIAVIDVAGEKYVEPSPDRPQGMSVAPDDPMHLHPRHRPAELGGTGRYPVWSISEEQLGQHLKFRQTSQTHGVVEPATRMLLRRNEEALAATRLHWTRVG